MSDAFMISLPAVECFIGEHFLLEIWSGPGLNCINGKLEIKEQTFFSFEYTFELLKDRTKTTVGITLVPSIFHLMKKDIKTENREGRKQGFFYPPMENYFI